MTTILILNAVSSLAAAGFAGLIARRRARAARELVRTQPVYVAARD